MASRFPEGPLLRLDASGRAFSLEAVHAEVRRSYSLPSLQYDESGFGSPELTSPSRKRSVEERATWSGPDVRRLQSVQSDDCNLPAEELARYHWVIYGNKRLKGDDKRIRRLYYRCSRHADLNCPMKMVVDMYLCPTPANTSVATFPSSSSSSSSSGIQGGTSRPRVPPTGTNTASSSAALMPGKGHHEEVVHVVRYKESHNHPTTEEGDKKALSIFPEGPSHRQQDQRTEHEACTAGTNAAGSSDKLETIALPYMRSKRLQTLVDVGKLVRRVTPEVLATSTPTFDDKAGILPMNSNASGVDEQPPAFDQPNNIGAEVVPSFFPKVRSHESGNPEVELGDIERSWEELLLGGLTEKVNSSSTATETHQQAVPFSFQIGSSERGSSVGNPLSYPPRGQVLGLKPTRSVARVRTGYAAETSAMLASTPAYERGGISYTMPSKPGSSHWFTDSNTRGTISSIPPIVGPDQHGPGLENTSLDSEEVQQLNLDLGMSELQGLHSLDVVGVGSSSGGVSLQGVTSMEKLLVSIQGDSNAFRLRQQGERNYLGRPEGGLEDRRELAPLLTLAGSKSREEVAHRGGDGMKASRSEKQELATSGWRQQAGPQSSSSSWSESPSGSSKQWVTVPKRVGTAADDDDEADEHNLPLRFGLY